ncbi:MAG: hypothetical protein ABSF95_18000 [Verrucomicrobiota bacterium]|jgi:hypothetical protein
MITPQTQNPKVTGPLSIGQALMACSAAVLVILTSGCIHLSEYLCAYDGPELPIREVAVIRAGEHVQFCGPVDGKVYHKGKGIYYGEVPSPRFVEDLGMRVLPGAHTVVVRYCESWDDALRRYAEYSEATTLNCEVKAGHIYLVEADVHAAPYQEYARKVRQSPSGVPISTGGSVTFSVKDQTPRQ